jgi:predicted phosphodiesterase
MATVLLLAACADIEQPIAAPEPTAGSAASPPKPMASGAGSMASGAGSMASGAGSMASGAGSMASGAGSMASGAIDPKGEKAAIEKQRPLSSKAWSFAVLSDLHVPNYRIKTVQQTVAALVDLKVRFVVVTGDHTNGAVIDGPRRMLKYPMWWKTLTDALRPLRDAGIAVFPTAGNHDSYLKPQRTGYAGAFADLAEWAKPYTIRPPTGDNEVSRPPFTYSVDIDGVHLAMIHTVKSALDPQVATWLENDLAAAKDARHRFVFSHVPLSSIIWMPNKKFVAHLGGILERGKADLYAAGHEHVVWDEDVTLPAGGKIRQLIVGCASGYYEYAPAVPAKKRAGCTPYKDPGKIEPARCKMPNGGEFRLAIGRRGRHLQHYTNAFMIVTVDGDQVRARPMTVDDSGKLLPFYLDER